MNLVLRPVPIKTNGPKTPRNRYTSVMALNAGRNNGKRPITPAPDKA